MGAVALSDLTFQIPTNGVFCVFGASESGKTTLLNTICGLTEIKQGCIYINNIRVDKNTPANHNICLALETGGFFENKSVKYNLEYPLKIRNINSDIIKRTIDNITEKFSLSDILNKKMKKADDDNRAKVKFAKLFIRESDIYLLDNPFKKVSNRKAFFEKSLPYIYELSKKSTVIYATDNPDEIIKLNTLTLILNYGIMTRCDKAENITVNPESLFTVKNFVKNSLTFEGNIKKHDNSVVLSYNNINKALDVKYLINDIYVGENVLVSEYFDKGIRQIKIFDINSEKLIYFKNID